MSRAEKRLSESTTFQALESRVTEAEADIAAIDPTVNNVVNNYTATITGGNMASAASYVSIAAALTAIGSTPTTLMLDTDRAVSTALVWPTNIDLVFTNGAKLTKSGTGTIEFQHPAITGDPMHKLFSGFSSGNVKWTGNYPDAFRPEWWGATADDNGSAGTDNLVPFNSVIAAMASGYPRGGCIKLATGGGYYLSDTWHVRRSVVVKGGANNTAVPNCYLRFPANTRGVVTHGLSTYDGTITTDNADGSIFDGVNLNGAIGGNNTIVSTSGLSITMTGGTYTQTGGIGNQSGPTLGSIPAFPDGATITLNGFTYAADIAQGDNSTKSTFSIQTPRFMVAYNSGTGKLDPIFGSFPSNSDWVGSTFTLRLPTGAQYNTTTYTITAHSTSQITFSGGAMPSLGAIEIEISGLKVMASQNARINIYPGFDVRSYKLSLRNLRVSGFAGDGVTVNTNQLPSAYFGSEPNANNCFFELVHCDFNAGHGYFFSGVNSNNVSTHLIDADNNGGYGVYESASLGQNHFGFHLMFNYMGPFRMVGSVAKNMVIACYTEGSQPAGIINGIGVVLGGLHGAGIRNHHILGATPLMYTDRSGNNPTEAWMCGIGSPGENNEGILFSFGSGTDAGSVANGGTIDRAISPSFILKQNYPLAGLYSVCYTDNALLSPTKILQTFSGDPAAMAAGRFVLFEGFATGNNSTFAADAVISRMIKGTVTIDPSSVAANTTAEQSFTLTGAATSDTLILNPPTAGLTAGLVVMHAYVSAANTIKVTFQNTTGSPIDQASGTWNYMIIR